MLITYSAKGEWKPKPIEKNKKKKSTLNGRNAIYAYDLSKEAFEEAISELHFFFNLTIIIKRKVK